MKRLHDINDVEGFKVGLHVTKYTQQGFKASSMIFLESIDSKVFLPFQKISQVECLLYYLIF